MKNLLSSQKTSSKGFTLVELLVALGVTAVIVSMLVTITATALDGYTTSRNTIKASREARAAFDQMTRDLESIVVRSGTNFEWLWISSEQNAPGPSDNPSPNASRAVFFTTATDRYNGALNTSSDNGGDVSTVAYRLLFRDPITDSDDEEFASFILYRQLINPDETFENLLGQPDLETAYQAFENNESNPENFVCENIYEFSLSFSIEFLENGVTRTERVLVVNSGGRDSVNDFRLRGDQIVADNDNQAVFSNGRIISADLSITVINDTALELLRNGSLPQAAKTRLLEENSHYYAKTILLPQP